MTKPMQNRLRFEVPASALARWDKSIVAKKHDNEEADGHVNLNIYSTVGEYGDGHGMTAKIVGGILRKAEGKDVVVNINSGGGDFFEGLAIHSLLSDYEGHVTVKVLGLAASAASVIAMAGDEIQVAKSAFIMIHNSWTMVIGNKEVLRADAALLEQFDKSMAELYAAKTGIELKEVEKLMKNETWMQGGDAVELKFAHALLDSNELDKDDEMKEPSALRKLDVELAKAGVPRSERRALIKELTATPCASETVTPRADAELKTALDGLLKNLKQ